MDDALRYHCNTCLGSRKHDQLQLFHKAYPAPDGEKVPGQREFWVQICECRGCESLTIRQIVRWQGLTTPDGSPVMQEFWYPPRVARHMPLWLYTRTFGKPNEAQLLQEIYKAFQNGQPRLAAMGIRALLDTLMTEKIGDIGGFDQKLDAFAEGGHISPKEAERLRTIIDAGSASAHRGHQPTDEDLTFLMDYTEHLFRSMYDFDDKAAELKKRTPPRPKLLKAPHAPDEVAKA